MMVICDESGHQVTELIAGRRYYAYRVLSAGNYSLGIQFSGTAQAVLLNEKSRFPMDLSIFNLPQDTVHLLIANPVNPSGNFVVEPYYTLVFCYIFNPTSTGSLTVQMGTDSTTLDVNSPPQEPVDNVIWAVIITGSNSLWSGLWWIEGQCVIVGNYSQGGIIVPEKKFGNSVFSMDFAREIDGTQVYFLPEEKKVLFADASGQEWSDGSSINKVLTFQAIVR